MTITIKITGPDDTNTVSALLVEAETWLEARGMSLWDIATLQPHCLAPDVAAGSYLLAMVNGVAVGTVKFQLADPEFWPDVPQHESAFLHKLVVSRAAAGQGVSAAMLKHAVERARSHGRIFLRLDTAADRAPLRRMYENFGFRHHSDRQVGAYYVARYELAIEATG